MFNGDGTRSRSHGLRPEILEAQMERLGLQPLAQQCEWATYDEAFERGLAEAAALGVTHVVFGDILFEEHRRWAERQCAVHGMTAVEPLWGSSTSDLFEEWVASGSEALIVTARAEFLDHTWLGRRLEHQLLSQFAQLGVDPCGERGEYHTVVTNTPLFSRPLRLRGCAHVQHAGCWALDMAVDDAEGA